MTDLHQDGDISPVCIIYILSPTNNLEVHTVLLQILLESNPVSSKLNCCFGQSWVSCRRGVTPSRLPGKFSYED